MEHHEGFGDHAARLTHHVCRQVSQQKFISDIDVKMIQITSKQFLKVCDNLQKAVFCDYEMILTLW